MGKGCLRGRDVEELRCGKGARQQATTGDLPCGLHSLHGGVGDGAIRKRFVLRMGGCVAGGGGDLCALPMYSGFTLPGVETLFALGRAAIKLLLGGGVCGPHGLHADASAMEQTCGLD